MGKLFNDSLDEMLDNSNSIVICDLCLKDSFLRDQASGKQCSNRRNVKSINCVDCGQLSVKYLSAKEIATLIRRGLKDNYFNTNKDDCSGSEIYTLKEMLKYSTKIECDQIICWIEHHLNKLDPSDFNSSYLYREVPPKYDSPEEYENHIKQLWDSKVKLLKHKHRFFNKEIIEFFDSLVKEAERAKKNDVSKISAVKYTTSKSSIFYRARSAKNLKAESKIIASPETEFWAPTVDLAADGRMSPRGIPFFYLASDTETSIAEVRPSLVDTVFVAEFESSKELVFFDFAAFEGNYQFDELSIFDFAYKFRESARAILGFIHQEIARPVNAEEMDYIFTQALSEYISINTSYDGLTFKSVQNKTGRNFVVFNANKESTDIFEAELKYRRYSKFNIESIEYKSSKVAQGLFG
ncbi:RES family NAD+ phosphorylase [Delftia tsuruhatensis]|uniref:RES family NAD+ phosphorylase n=1 Tax=Delftia tsuruhatensis TaxID=180282 RepID=UPI002AD231B3|nr:RES family NAD+ phosphorylase [Delftia tsuruhatensis]WQM85991.1 RES family NAD+ phosphorylase [Delftia tsuruhatensis]